MSLRSRRGNRFGIGARVELYSVDAATAGSTSADELDDADLAAFVANNYTQRQLGEIVTTTSSFSATQPMVSFGLKSDTEVALIKVTWPDGVVTHKLVHAYQSNVTLVEPGSYSRWRSSSR